MPERPAVPVDRPRDIIVIGASAGGLDPLTQLMSGLPADLPAAIFVVVHIPANARSMLPEILQRAGRLPAAHAVDGEPIRHSHIYVAPPDKHMLVQAGKGRDFGLVRLTGGPRENFSRPAVDTLFRSAAVGFGNRTIGVVLSGTLRDGTAGLWEISQHGGLAVVQDPGEAAYPAMPHSAMDQAPVDYVVSVAQMAQLLVKLVSRGTSEAAGEDRDEGGQKAMEAQDRECGGEPHVEGIASERPGSGAVARDIVEQVRGQRDGAVSVYVCPECGGSLWQVNAGSMVRFRCHVGHVYTVQNLLEGYSEDTERALWTAIRTLRDRANLTRQLAQAAGERDLPDEAGWYEKRTKLDDQHASEIESMLETAGAVSLRS